MQRIDGPTAAPSLPAPSALVGTPGYFTGGDPAIPTPPTIITPDWFNMIQEELVAIVVAAGISPSKSDRAQVLAAVRSLIASGGISFASDAEAIAGVLTGKALSPHSGAALVAAQINAIVNGAPTALNTLKELADAIGDDANFAGTMTAALSARMLTSWTLTAAGLATGGGTGEASRTVTVPKATAAQVAAGTDDASAVTPLALAQGRGLEQYGSLSGPLSPGVYTCTFPAPFPNACKNVQLTGINVSGTSALDTWPQLQTRFPGGFTFVVQTSQTGGVTALDGVDWTAKGN
ncbi:hypothetical protein [Sphingomonas sp. CARO-RG-8B-R24-01]|uniref:gp53-like domain-containing protein n=1 Tax=Sphingomonas sp. CARO-RG-8B-R24-01 TaxID=2914831 RepID=UPI001F593CBE|nr:hypothetical protein [Sphingomonas sp. CARO-RG-8B-R24-01]